MPTNVCALAKQEEMLRCIAGARSGIYTMDETLSYEGIVMECFGKTTSAVAELIAENYIFLFFEFV